MALTRISAQGVDLRGLSPSLADLARALLVVGLLHLGLLMLFRFGFPDFTIKKRPDITIEFYAPPPQQQATATPRVAPAAPPRPAPAPPQQPTPKVEPQPQNDQPELPVSPPESSKTATAPAAPSAPALATDGVAQTADADYKAAYLKNPKPPYPAIAVRMRAEGRVVLFAQVLPDGRAGEVRVEVSSGYAVLDRSALETVRTWRFTPARKDGKIVTQAVRIPIDFNLRNAR